MRCRAARSASFRCACSPSDAASGRRCTHTRARRITSSIDDGGALLGTPGFLSIVIPNFAIGPVGFDGAFVAEHTDEGEWAAIAPAARLEVIP